MGKLTNSRSGSDHALLQTVLASLRDYILESEASNRKVLVQQSPDSIARQYKNTKEFYELISAQPDFEALGKPQSNILCFRYTPLPKMRSNCICEMICWLVEIFILQLQR